MMVSEKIGCVVLAAGEGKRMASALPKVLYPIAGMPMLVHLLQTLGSLPIGPVVLVLSPKNQQIVSETLAHWGYTVGSTTLLLALQEVPLGTGDAVRFGMKVMPGSAEEILMLYGDVPLLQASTIQSLLQSHKQQPLTLLSASRDDPFGYGRILRDPEGDVLAVVEEKDCNSQQRAIQEINAGVYLAKRLFLEKSLKQLQAKNAQGEFYLTDIVASAASSGGCQALLSQDSDDILGVNRPSEAAYVESVFQKRQIKRFTQQGVRFLDADHSYLDAQVTIEAGSTIGMQVQIYGKSHIAAHAHIEGPTLLRQTQVHQHVHIKAFSYCEQAILHEHSSIGPFARLRPGSIIGSQALVGNFVEIKNTTLGTHSKASHLAYLGDGDVGDNCNIGAGTIFCNYDGFHKYTTKLGDKVFIGSNSTLVAPVYIASDSIVAAGSVITEDVPANSLAIGRSRQSNKVHYAAKLRERLRQKRLTSKS